MSDKYTKQMKVNGKLETKQEGKTTKAELPELMFSFGREVLIKKRQSFSD